jgi:hypothetical protein
MNNQFIGNNRSMDYNSIQSNQEANINQFSNPEPPIQLLHYSTTAASTTHQQFQHHQQNNGNTTQTSSPIISSNVESSVVGSQYQSGADGWPVFEKIADDFVKKRIIEYKQLFFKEKEKSLAVKDMEFKLATKTYPSYIRNLRIKNPFASFPNSTPNMEHYIS